MSKSEYYEIRVKGHLDPHWSDRLGGLRITIDGDVTLIAGYIVDQSALHGLISQIRDSGLKLVSVEQIDCKIIE